VKKSLFVMGLVGFLAANTQAADLFGALKKASDTVDKAQAQVADTQAKVEQTSAAASNATSTPEESALALVKSKLGDNATKAQVQSVLGAPVTTSGEQTAEVWLYNVSSVNATAAQAAQVAAAFGVNAPGANKQVAVHFAGDKVIDVVIAEAVAAE
jgi:hypothetical protein